MLQDLTIVYIGRSMELTPSWKRGRPCDLDQYFNADVYPYESHIDKASAILTQGWRFIKRIVKGNTHKPVSLLQTILNSKAQLRSYPKRIPSQITPDMLRQIQSNFGPIGLNLKRWRQTEAVAQQERPKSLIDVDSIKKRQFEQSFKITQLDKLKKKRKVYPQFKGQLDDSKTIVTFQILQRNIRLAADSLRDVQQNQIQQDKRSLQTTDKLIINDEGSKYFIRIQQSNNKQITLNTKNHLEINKVESQLPQNAISSTPQQSNNRNNIDSDNTDQKLQKKSQEDNKNQQVAVSQTIKQKEQVKTVDSKPKTNPFLSSPVKPIKLMDVICNNNIASNLLPTVFSYSPSNNPQYTNQTDPTQTKSSQNNKNLNNPTPNVFSSNQNLLNVSNNQSQINLPFANSNNKPEIQIQVNDRSKFNDLFNQPKLNPTAPMPSGQTVFQMNPSRIQNKPSINYSQPIHQVFNQPMQVQQKPKQFSFLDGVQTSVTSRHVDFFQTSNKNSNPISLFEISSNVNSQRTEKKKYGVTNRRKKQDKGERIS